MFAMEDAMGFLNLRRSVLAGFPCGESAPYGVSDLRSKSSARYVMPAREGVSSARQRNAKKKAELMKRRVFFSFHYQKDIWRVNQVRKSGEFRDVSGTDTFYDNSLWEEAKKKGDVALKKLIAEGMQNSSVTTVLAAAETWKRKWVRYELIKSFERGNGLITLWIDRAKDSDGNATIRGYNPLDCLHFAMNSDGKTASTSFYNGSEWVAYETIGAGSLPKAAKYLKKGKLSSFASVHSWVSGSAEQFAVWANAAAENAGR